MKQLFIILAIYIFFPIVSNGQDTTQNWHLRASFGIEKHDKRLFDYVEKEMLLALNPEDWGTYHFNLSIYRKLKYLNRFTFFIGTGLDYEKATFLRPFDHFYFMKDNFKILRNLNKYEKVLMPLSFSGEFRIIDQLYMDFDLRPTFIVYRRIDHTENNAEVFPYTEGSFELDEVHFNLGINYQIKHFLFGFNSRVFNYQKIDKIILNNIIKDPRTDQKWEWYNPLRFDFTIGYMW